MKTLQVSNGDIVLDQGGRLQFVQGSSKLVQDLALWLKEPIGAGFTTPNFGSVLTSLVGSSETSAIVAQVQAEVSRILGLYQSQQLIDLQSAQNTAQLSNWNKSEIITTINSINVSTSYTTINVYVDITTLAGSNLSLNLLVDPNGVQVLNG